MSFSPPAEAGSELPELGELATPGLYRRNLFRVLGLSPRVATRDARRELERRHMQAKLGLAATEATAGPVPLIPPPPEDVVRAAVERLHQPLRRFLDELFWFWPPAQAGREDPAWASLLAGDLPGAIAAWRQACGAPGADPSDAHNLAVACHMLALDREDDPRRPRTQSAHAARFLDGLWEEAYRRWQETVASEAFWAQARARAAELNDAQLTTALVDHVRARLLPTIAAVGARLAYQAAEAGDASAAERCIDHMRRAGWDAERLEGATREAVRPAQARLLAAVAGAKAKCNATRHRARAHLDELVTQARSILPVCAAILGGKSQGYCALCTTVAEAIVEGALVHGNSTNDWKGCLALLDVALPWAHSEALRAQIEEQRGILKKNAESGNDWYSPGYWELPPDAVAALEDAHAKERAGDHMGALRILTALDPALGAPLKRCTAYSLSQEGWRLALEAIRTEFDEPTAPMRRFLATLRKTGSVSVPNQFMQSWELPPCPAHETSYSARSYTRWSQGTFQGQEFWMCSECSEEDDREKRERRRRAGKAVRGALAYGALACEVDPDDAGTKKSLASLQKVGRDLDVSGESTAALRRQFGADRERWVRHQTPARTTCAFCGHGQPVPSHALTVPMHGPRRPVPSLFGDASEHAYDDVVVPRCAACHRQHRELPERQAEWERARTAAGAPERFPALVAEVRAAEAAAAEADKAATKGRARRTEAEAESARVKKLGTTCERCSSKWGLQQGLCASCDGRVFGLSAPVKCLVVVLGVVVALVVCRAAGADQARRLLRAADQAQGVGAALGPSDAGFLGFFASLLLWSFAKVQLRARRARLSRTRLESLRRIKAEQQAPAERAVEEAQALLAPLEAQLERARARLTSARDALAKAGDAGQEEFVRSNPIPDVARDTSHEGAFLTLEPIAGLLGTGWRFGHGKEGGGTLSDIEPQQVRGLVDKRALQVRRWAYLPVLRDIEGLSRTVSAGTWLACPACALPVPAGTLPAHFHAAHEAARAAASAVSRG